MRLISLALLVGLAGPAAAQTFADSLSRTDHRITSGEFADEFVLTLDRGRTLRADLRSPDFNTYLILIAPSGEQIENDDASNADSSHSHVEVEGGEGGTWRILVTSADVGETGAYTLVVETEAPASGGPAAPPAVDPLRGDAALDPALGGFGWVLGSHGAEEAEREAARYRRLGYRAAMVRGTAGGRTVYRVVVGQFATREAAEATRNDLPADAPNDAWILSLAP